jgi:hypothetical protein
MRKIDQSIDHSYVPDIIFCSEGFSVIHMFFDVMVLAYREFVGSKRKRPKRTLSIDPKTAGMTSSSGSKPAISLRNQLLAE